MRALLYILLTGLVFGLLIFSFTNEARVTVNMPWAVYPEAALWKIVWMAVVGGVMITAIFALAEGAQARLINRRLKREIHKLETENSYLRTQPPVLEPRERPASSAVHSPSAPARGSASRTKHAPSAPVYGSDADENSPDAEDDMYTGGRAV